MKKLLMLLCVLVLSSCSSDCELGSIVSLQKSEVSDHDTIYYYKVRTANGLYKGFATDIKHKIGEMIYTSNLRTNWYRSPYN